MKQITGKLGVVQNIGLVDRMFRFFAGGALLAGGILGMVAAGTVTLLTASAALLAVYPLMTTMMGWDPFYQLFGSRTCNVEGGRNQCGTFPYEVDSALGRNPHPDEGHEYDHSLTGSHHDEPRHKAAA